jgi:hypothetical protein
MDFVSKAIFDSGTTRVRFYNPGPMDLPMRVHLFDVISKLRKISCLSEDNVSFLYVKDLWSGPRNLKALLAPGITKVRYLRFFL